MKGESIMAWLEKGYNLAESAKIAVKNLTPGALGTGFVAAIFSIMGPALIVMNAAKQGNLDNATATSWLFIIYLTGGLFTLFYSLRYRLPIVAAYSIPGAVLIGKSMNHLSFAEVVGATIIVGIITLLIAVSGVIKKAVDSLPLPVMLAMISGVMLSFGTNVVSAAATQPLLVAPAIMAFFGLLFWKRLSKTVPPILGAVLMAVVMVSVLGLGKWDTLQLKLASPMLYTTPAFTLAGFFELALPLTILAIGVQNIQAIGVLLAEKYQPPTNAIFIMPALGTFLNAAFGGHPCVTAGPSTAICSGASAGEKKELRYVASITDGFIWMAFALVAGVAIEAASLVPKEVTAMLAGLAMFDVLLNAFAGAFSGKFRVGALVAFLIAVSNVTILNIGAPFWSLVLGLVFSLIFDKADFVKVKQEVAIIPDAKQGTEASPA